MTAIDPEFRAERGRRRRRAALAATGLLASVGILVGSSMSAFQSQVDVTTDASIASVELRANGDAVSHTVPAATFANMEPGETRSYPLNLSNVASTDGTVTVETFGAATPANVALEYAIKDPGGNVVTSGQLTDNAAASLAGLSDGLLKAGETEAYSLEITLPQSAADNDPTLAGQTVDDFALRFVLTP